MFASSSEKNYAAARILGQAEQPSDDSAKSIWAIFEACKQYEPTFGPLTLPSPEDGASENSPNSPCSIVLTNFLRRVSGLAPMAV